MNTNAMANRITPSALRKSLLMICMLTNTSVVSALDNPDAPHYVADFTTRAQPYESKLAQGAGNTQDFSNAYSDYEKFLDKELNTAYSLLNKQLKGHALMALRASQREWLKFRDSEYKFIGTNWTRDNFGTSSTISRGDYRTAIVKQRVTSLLNYLQNYSSTP